MRCGRVQLNRRSCKQAAQRGKEMGWQVEHGAQAAGQQVGSTCPQPSRQATSGQHMSTTKPVHALLPQPRCCTHLAAGRRLLVLADGALLLGQRALGLHLTPINGVLHADHLRARRAGAGGGAAVLQLTVAHRQTVSTRACWPDLQAELSGTKHKPTVAHLMLESSAPCRQ